MTNEILKPEEKQLYNQACQIIESRKNSAITSVNQHLTLMYWEIGRFIKENILIEDRGLLFSAYAFLKKGIDKKEAS